VVKFTEITPGVSEVVCVSATVTDPVPIVAMLAYATLFPENCNVWVELL
jgi:hypothetical protein